MPNTSTFTSPTTATGTSPAFRRSSGSAPEVEPEPPLLRRHPHLVRYSDVEADFDALIDKAIAAIADCEPVEDEILGRYVNIASMVRAVSFREGKLLELAFERLSKVIRILLSLSSRSNSPWSRPRSKPSPETIGGISTVSGSTARRRPREVIRPTSFW